MIRPYLPIFLALIILAVPKESAGQYANFADLSEVAIVVDKLEVAAEKFGLDEMAIKRQVLVLLQSKLPDLIVNDAADSGVGILIIVGESKGHQGNTLGYFGSVSVGLTRKVTIMKTGAMTSGYLWYGARAIKGPTSGLIEHVRDVLDQLLTDLAAVWHRDNP